MSLQKTRKNITEIGAEHENSYTIGEHAYCAPAPAPGLYVVATPIGNLRDVTLRALETLAGVGAILCEDTRVTRKLLSRYRISTPLISYHDHNAHQVRPGILSRLSADEALALVSDAGTPLISDPGFRLVREAREAGITVLAVPGPSAPLAAISIAGLACDRFLFAGFLPAKRSERRRTLEELLAVDASLIFFESPRRLLASLRDLGEVMGGRDVAIFRELTKLHEEALVGRPSELADTLAPRDSIRGEITLVVAPPVAANSRSHDQAEIDDAIRAAVARMPASQAAADIATAYGLPRRAVYQRILQIRDRGQDDEPESPG